MSKIKRHQSLRKVIKNIYSMIHSQYVKHVIECFIVIDKQLVLILREIVCANFYVRIDLLYLAYLGAKACIKLAIFPSSKGTFVEQGYIVHIKLNQGTVIFWGWGLGAADIRMDQVRDSVTPLSRWHAIL